MTDWNLKPDQIEAQSFAIIDQEAGKHAWPPAAWSVVRRMIHTTADFSWVNDTIIGPGAIEAGIAALKSGALLVTDTNMALSGLALKTMASWGVAARCLIGEPETAELAAANGTTRALAAVDLAAERYPEAVQVIGNAPTALFRLLEHMAAGRMNPPLVVGLPVGFVNAAEAKEALAASGTVCITARGRKGGSAVAASVINALARLAREEG